MISLTNHDSSEGEQWGRNIIYPDGCTRSPHKNGMYHPIEPMAIEPIP